MALWDECSPTRLMTTLLIVEDDDAIRNNVIRLLKLEGYEVVAAVQTRPSLE